MAGRADPGFECQHSHCKGRNGFEFLEKIGFTNVADDFDVVLQNAQDEAEGLLARVRNAKSPRAVVDYLRTLPRDDVIARWAGLAASLSKDAAQDVIEEVHRMTAVGVRRLAAALNDARDQAAVSRKQAVARSRVANRKVIEYRPEDRTQLARELESAIVATAAPGEYVSFGGILSCVSLKPLPYTHLVDDQEGAPPAVPQIEPLDDVSVLSKAERVAAFCEMREGVPQLMAVPQAIVEILLKKKDHTAPVISGLVTHPIVLPRDGSILAVDGLHAASGLFLTGASVPNVRAFDQSEAAQALRRIRAEFLDGFEFASELDADAALAGLLTGVQRRLLDTAPGLAVMASTQSSGKTTLARRIHVLLTGQDMPVSTFLQGDEAEVQKRLLSMLLRSPAMVCFDNLLDGTTFRSGAVAAAMTGPLIEQRVLGLSRDAKALTNVLFAITGNNISLGADEVTRWMVARLKPQTARPEERIFRHPDVVRHALRMRESVLRDVVGIIAGYIQHGAAIPAGSRFPRWDRMVRQPLMWAGGSDMAEAFRANASNSEDVLAHQALLFALRELFPDGAEFAAADVATKVRAADFGGAETVEGRLASAMSELRAKDPTSERSIGRVLRALVDRIGELDDAGRKAQVALRSRTLKGRLLYWVQG